MQQMGRRQRAHARNQCFPLAGGQWLTEFRSKAVKDAGTWWKDSVRESVAETRSMRDWAIDESYLDL